MRRLWSRGAQVWLRWPQIPCIRGGWSAQYEVKQGVYTPMAYSESVLDAGVMAGRQAHTPHIILAPTAADGYERISFPATLQLRVSVGRSSR